MANASEARKVVYELFQDLDRFSLDDYQPFADIDDSKARILEFLRTALEEDGGSLEMIDEWRLRLTINGRHPVICTLDRERAQADETVELLGIDHPIVNEFLSKWRSAPPSVAGAAARMGLSQ